MTSLGNAPGLGTEAQPGIPCHVMTQTSLDTRRRHERAVHGGVAHPDAVVALEVPHDADRPEVVGPAQVKHLLDDCGGIGVKV